MDFIKYLMMLFASLLFIAGCGSGESEEPAEESAETTEEAEDNASLSAPIDLPEVDEWASSITTAYFLSLVPDNLSSIKGNF